MEKEQQEEETLRAHRFSVSLERKIKENAVKE